MVVNVDERAMQQTPRYCIQKARVDSDMCACVVYALVLCVYNPFRFEFPASSGFGGQVLFEQGL